ncbi:hypothetical protein, partial [Frankia sp. EI5c]|uniref:hypothetical protein n=1 Tax=Frankia sp. EI5c TaxID=683316 RepID=UPI001F5C00CA
MWWLRPVLLATTVACGTAMLGRLIGRTIRHPALTGFCLSTIGLYVTLTAVGARETAP